MGNWKLEVFRMAIYMAFPVGLFHYFNQPEYFEEWVTKTRKEIYPPDDEPQIVEMEKAIKIMKRELELQALKQFEEAEKL